MAWKVAQNQIAYESGSVESAPYPIDGYGTGTIATYSSSSKNYQWEYDDSQAKDYSLLNKFVGGNLDIYELVDPETSSNFNSVVNELVG
jgi:hypothetical protein